MKRSINSSNWWRTGVLGYGKPGPKVGGFVTISSLVDGRIKKSRVSIRPAFDPNAVSMTPILGWTAGDLALAA